MTRNDRRAIATLLALLALVWLLAHVPPTDSRQTPTWTVPPSAIVAITAAPGEQREPEPAVLSAGRAEPAATVSPRLPRGIGAEADHEAPTAPTAVPPTARPAASHSLAELVHVGVASNMGPAFPPTYLALPQGPGWLARICGPGGCVTRVSTDTGPERWTGRVADLSVHDFEAVSGESWRMGLVSVSVVLTRRAG